MITVLESIKLSTDFLAGKGIESPRTNAELLLGHIIGCKRLDLYLLFDRPLSGIELQQYREYIKRRGTFEPLQYILGKVEFYGLELIVNQTVLIPRPETELLVENIINQSSKEKESMILDVGCGSGNISIALAVNLETVNIITTDIREETLQVAKANAKKHSVSNRIKFINHNILENDFNNFPMFDIIVSNPPYVSKENFSTLQREIKDFEPRTAVTDESDGYTFFKVIAKEAATKLTTNGKLFFEIADGQSDGVRKIMEQNNFDNITVIKDYQKIDRIVYGEIK
ncbi:MAG: peptide chain release factor N(5)-glutamine methyltransferase [Ignavibacteria bacterium]|nr:peptide chain release factor N(5)-glutamine methyltransferase [Ignavibacteria bacterium]